MNSPKKKRKGKKNSYHSRHSNIKSGEKSNTFKKRYNEINNGEDRKEKEGRPWEEYRHTIQRN